MFLVDLTLCTLDLKLDLDDIKLDLGDSGYLPTTIALFDAAVNSVWLRRIPYVLIFSNVKPFRESLKETNSSTIWPEYHGDNKIDTALSYIVNRFKAVAKSPSRDENNHDHVIEIANDDLVPKLIHAIKDIIIQTALDNLTID